MMGPTTRQTAESDRTSDGLAPSSNEKPKPSLLAVTKPAAGAAGDLSDARKAVSIITRPTAGDKNTGLIECRREGPESKNSAGSVVVVVASAAPKRRGRLYCRGATVAAAPSAAAVPGNGQRGAADLGHDGYLQSPAPSMLTKLVNDTLTLQPGGVKRAAVTKAQDNDPKRQKLLAPLSKQPLAGQGIHDELADRKNADGSRTLEGGRPPATPVTAAPALSGESSRDVTAAGLRLVTVNGSNGSCPLLGRGGGSSPAVVASSSVNGRHGSDLITRCHSAIGAAQSTAVGAASTPGVQALAADLVEPMLHVVLYMNDNTTAANDPIGLTIASAAGHGAIATRNQNDAPRAVTQREPSAAGHGAIATRNQNDVPRAVTQREPSAVAAAGASVNGRARPATAGGQSTLAAASATAQKTSASASNVGKAAAVVQLGMQEMRETAIRAASTLSVGAQPAIADPRSDVILQQSQQQQPQLPPAEVDPKLKPVPVPLSRFHAEQWPSSAVTSTSCLSNFVRIMPAAGATVDIASTEIPSSSYPDIVRIPAVLGITDVGRQLRQRDEVIDLISDDDDDSDCLEVTHVLPSAVSKHGGTTDNSTATHVNKVISTLSAGSPVSALSPGSTTTDCNNSVVLSSLMQTAGTGSTGSACRLTSSVAALPCSVYSPSMPSLQPVTVTDSVRLASAPVQLQTITLESAGDVLRPTVSAITESCQLPLPMRPIVTHIVSSTVSPLLLLHPPLPLLPSSPTPPQPLPLPPSPPPLLPSPPQLPLSPPPAQLPSLPLPPSPRILLVPPPLPPSTAPFPPQPLPKLPLSPPPLQPVLSLPLLPVQHSSPGMEATSAPSSGDVADVTSVQLATLDVQQSPQTNQPLPSEDTVDVLAADKPVIANPCVTSPCKQKVADLAVSSPLPVNGDPTEDPQALQATSYDEVKVSNGDDIPMATSDVLFASESPDEASSPARRSEVCSGPQGETESTIRSKVKGLQSYLKRASLQRQAKQPLPQLSSWSCRTRGDSEAEAGTACSTPTDGGSSGSGRVALVMSRCSFVRTPRGLTCPAPSRSRLKALGKRHKGSLLCICKWKPTKLAKSKTSFYCQAQDCVDGMPTGCFKSAANACIGSPSLKVPNMALCKDHFQRLRGHQCCPGCGRFCVSGQFLQCRADSSYVHLYHQSCQVTKAGKAYCPHCDEESAETKVFLRRPRHLPRWQLLQATSDVTSSEMATGVPKTCRIKSTARPVLFGNASKQTVTVAESPQLVPKAVSAVLCNQHILSTVGLEVSDTKQVVDLAKVLEKLASTGLKELRKSAGTLGTVNQAVRNNSVVKLVCILADGVDPNDRIHEADGGSPLHVASKLGHLVIVHCLLQVGAMPNMMDNNESTPLMLACTGNHLPVVKHLIRAGAKVNMRDSEGQTALHVAAKAGCLAVAKFLVSTTEIDINIQDLGGWTALAWSTENLHTAVAKYLLRTGSNPSLRDKEQNTCLHWAVYSGSAELSTAYLDAGCSIEAVNANGDRALHIAARRGHYGLVSMLLARGADSKAINNLHQMPHECTASSKIMKALTLNLQLKSFKTSEVKFTETLLHCDITRGRERIPISCINSVDDMNFPEDYVYVTSNVESAEVFVNRAITSIQRCNCIGDCSTASCGCARTGGRCWYDEHGRLLPDVSLSESLLIIECNQGCHCWMNCRNRVVQLGTRCCLQLFRTEKLGWGVRTLNNIPRGTFICEYTGEIISDLEADRRQHDSYLFDLDSKDGETYCIDGFAYGNIGRFINHHCDPNIAPVHVLVEHRDVRFPRICFFAVRDIIASEELGFDYGDDFWFIKYKSFTCECRSSNCKFSRDTIARTMAEHGRKLDEKLLLDIIPTASP